MASLTNHPARIAATGKHWRGPPCPAHGDVLRWVSTGGCVDCGRVRSRESARLRAAADPARQARIAARAARKAAEAERRARPNIVDDPARQAALAAGEATWSGRPCRYGHDERYASNPAACVECRRISNKEYLDGR